MNKPEHIKNISNFLFLHKRNIVFIYSSLLFIFVYEVVITILIFNNLMSSDFRSKNLFSFVPSLLPLFLSIYAWISAKKVKKISALKIDLKQLTDEEIDLYFFDDKEKLKKMKSSLFKEKNI